MILLEHLWLFSCFYYRMARSPCNVSGRLLWSIIYTDQLKCIRLARWLRVSLRPITDRLLRDICLYCKIEHEFFYLLLLSANLDWPLHQLDVKGQPGALKLPHTQGPGRGPTISWMLIVKKFFLNGGLEEVYMDGP